MLHNKKVRALIPIHSHPLTLPTQFPLSTRTDRSRALRGTRLLQRQKLLGAERLVVNLRGGFDEILEVGAGEEVA